MAEQFICNVCDYESKYKENIGTHHTTSHLSHLNIKFKCSDCDSQFTMKDNLITLQASVHEENNLTIQRSNLRTHIISVHEGMMFPCESCDYLATEKSNLRKHIKSIHEGIRFSCESCEYLSTQNFSLK